MSDQKIVYTQGGSSLLTVLTVVFIVLKITGTTVVATWSWWWVLAPIWIPVVIALGTLGLVGIIMLAIALIMTLNK